MSSVFFESWGRIGALAVAVVVAYGWLVFVLRVTGKRTLAKLNAFDFVVTIALGSTLATVVVSRDVPIAEGALALASLVLLQFIAAWAAQRWSWFDQMVKSQPTALVVHGELREATMRTCRVRADEVAAALRKHGFASFEQVDYVVLETDGTFSVLEHVDRSTTALEGVEGIDHGDDVGERPIGRRQPRR